MPRVKTTTPKKSSPRVSKSDGETLDDFEQFLAQSPQRQNGGRSKGWLFATLLIIVIILGGALIYMSKNTKIEKELPYKSIYIENGADGVVYFAKVAREDAYYIYLEDIFTYVSQPKYQPAESEDSDPVLVGYDNVLVSRNTDKEMQINRNKVIAIEELSEDSQELADIERYNNQNK